MRLKTLCGLLIAINLPIVWMAAQTEEGKTAALPDPTKVALYDADPGHLWNRLYAAIFIRVDSKGNAYGPESPDPLFWTETKHLTAEPSSSSALNVLDEFIEKHGEKLIADPVKRAVMQRDLIAAYYWTVRMGNIQRYKPTATDVKDLRSRLVAVIKLIALSKEQIEALPDNYATTVASGKYPVEPDAAHPGAPFLPGALFQPDGPWVCITRNDKFSIAQTHVNGTDANSTFLVFLRLPEGREALSGYLEKIQKTPLYVPNPNSPKNSRIVGEALMQNPTAPQIPPGTMAALTRQMILIDDHGRPIATHFTESVQLRVYRKIQTDNTGFDEEHAQFFYKFVLDRKQLLSNPGALRALDSDEKGFVSGPDAKFSGIDDFESESGPHPFPMVQHCIICHRAAGVYSINSIVFIGGGGARLLHLSTPEEEKKHAMETLEKNWATFFEPFK